MDVYRPHQPAHEFDRVIVPAECYIDRGGGGRGGAMSRGGDEVYADVVPHRSPMSAVAPAAFTLTILEFVP